VIGACQEVILNIWKANINQILCRSNSRPHKKILHKKMPSSSPSPQPEYVHSHSNTRPRRVKHGSGMVVHACDPSYSRGQGKRIVVWVCQKLKVECLASKCKALSSNLSSAKKKSEAWLRETGVETDSDLNWLQAKYPTFINFTKTCEHMNPFQSVEGVSQRQDPWLTFH
jgi:hypothetical protein